MPTANPATETRDYEAHHLLVLEGLEAVRKRPAMYIGSTDTRGLMHCLWEIIDNAVDEALGGWRRFRSHCGPMAASRWPTGAAASRLTSNRVPGFPGSRSCSPSCTREASLATAATTRPAASRRGLVGGERAGQPAGRRGGSQRRHLGDVVPAGYAWKLRRAGAERQFIAGGGLRGRAGRPRAWRTRVTYWPDRQIFLKDAALSLAELEERARQTSFLVPGLAPRSPTPAQRR